MPRPQREGHLTARGERRTLQRMAKREPDWSPVEAAFSDAPSGRARSVAALRGYFKPVDWRGRSGFTGSAFESFAGGGDAPEVRDRFTADDVLAVTFLGVFVPARAAQVLTADVDGNFTALLSEIPTELNLEDVESPLEDVLPATWALDKAVDDLLGLGPTKTSKLLARKRPRLLPVLDEVTRKALGNPRLVWEPLRLRLRDGLAEQLRELATEAAVPSNIRVLRAFDVVLWMRHRRGAESYFEQVGR